MASVALAATVKFSPLGPARLGSGVFFGVGFPRLTAEKGRIPRIKTTNHAASSTAEESPSSAGREIYLLLIWKCREASRIAVEAFVFSLASQ